jgi:phosphatidate cytidylyltransferase
VVVSELTRRVLFGVVAAPVAIWAMLAGGAPLAAFLAIISALGAWEFYRIARAGGATPLSDAGIVLAGVVPLAVHAHYLRVYTLPLAAVAVAILALCAAAIWVRGVDGRPLASVATTIMGVLYTGGMLSFGYAVRYHEYVFGFDDAPNVGVIDALGGWRLPPGGVLLLLPILLTWASDIGAYFVGRAFGKRKLIPSVSPGKTVAGAVGGLLGSVVVAWLYVQFVLRPIGQMTLTPLGIVVFGVVVSVSAQVGDLFESLLKREAGVKDSSKLLPGHGGILDRFDSLIFVLPVSYLLVGWLLQAAPHG